MFTGIIDVHGNHFPCVLQVLSCSWDDLAPKPDDLVALPVLKELVLFRNAVGDAGCASLVAFLQCGFLPCLCCPEHFLQGCPASEAARQAVVRTIRRRP